LPDLTFDRVTDFTGEDQFEFAADGFGAGFDDGDARFVVIEEEYDGTNSGTALGTATFVYDGVNGTLYFDDDVATEGYTVVASVQNAGAAAEVNQDQVVLV
jgi:hypothetical protein